MGFIGLYSTGQFKLLSTSPQGEEAGSGPTEAFSNYKSVTAVQRWRQEFSLFITVNRKFGLVLTRHPKGYGRKVTAPVGEYILRRSSLSLAF
jgi:hypothetical protein